MDYKTQLKQPEWREKRCEIITRDRHKCKFCGENRWLNVHHWTYDDGKLAWEYEDNRLVTFCKDCHEWYHKLNGFSVPVNGGKLSVYDFLLYYPVIIWDAVSLSNQNGIWEFEFRPTTGITESIHDLSMLKRFMGNTDHFIIVKETSVYNDDDWFNLYEYLTGKSCNTL